MIPGCHTRYDKAADWLEARRWTQHVAIYGGTFATSYGLLFGFAFAWAWLLLVLGAPLGVLVLRVQWHGFLRRLDRKYPIAAQLECSFDASWIRELSEAE